MALPFPGDTFDAAVMPLVIFFVPTRPKGRRNGTSGLPRRNRRAYAWDMPGGGFPYESLRAEMRAMGVTVPAPPSPEASRMDTMRDLWTGAGLDAVETQEIAVQRTFADFEDYWTSMLGGPSTGRGLAAMASEDLAILKARDSAASAGRMPPAVSPIVRGRMQ